MTGWIQLGSNRLKNQPHVVEVLEVVSPDARHRVERRLSAVHPVLLQRFRDFVEAADEEQRSREQ